MTVCCLLDRPVVGSCSVRPSASAQKVMCVSVPETHGQSLLWYGLARFCGALVGPVPGLLWPFDGVAVDCVDCCCYLGCIALKALAVAPGVVDAAVPQVAGGSMLQFGDGDVRQDGLRVGSLGNMVLPSHATMDVRFGAPLRIIGAPLRIIEHPQDQWSTPQDHRSTPQDHVCSHMQSQDDPMLSRPAQFVWQVAGR
jgi:hypothetical protein